MSKRKTEQDYHNLAASRGFLWSGSGGQNNKQRTKWQCSRQHEWWARYNDIQQGKGCPFCAKKAPKTPNDYHAVAQANNCLWLGPVVKTTKIKTRWKCSDGHEWQTSLKDLRTGGCPFCANNRRKTAEEYHALANSMRVEWMGPEAPNGTTKTWWRCSQGHEWKATYANIKHNGSRCPYCARQLESAGVKAIADCLHGLKIQFEQEKKFRQCRGVGGGMLPYDFFFVYDSQVVLIEFDHRQHYEPVDFFGGESAFKRQRKHDSIKDMFAKRKGYILIRIPYTVKQIETHLIQSIADATGKTFDDLACNSPCQPAAF